MRKLCWILLLLPLFSLAQTGMHFEHNLTWKEIQAKAKAENKYIFMDAFTTWCGPCKAMAANIFPMEEVGNFFNKNFINVKVQLDTTKADNDEVKSWYADAGSIMKDYKVNVFPTYLFFDPNGKLVHRAIGSSPADVFIAKGNDALNPEKQYYTLLDKYKAGEKSPEFLRKMAVAALDMYDRENSSKIGKEYLATQKDLFTKENLDFVDKFTSSSKDPGFALIMNNDKKYDEVKGSGSASKKLVGIIANEDLYPAVFRKDSPTPDWTALDSKVAAKYPKYSKEVISMGKVMYYQSKSDWPNFQTAVLAYMNDYGANASSAQLNSFAWAVFENCKDMTCVKEALDWSKRSFAAKDEPMYIDTYANILYKMGKKEEAIKWEEKALALANNDKTYQETLDKMKKGEKTWKD
ncbi:MAG: thioredoxin fold domain-containing protein [Williamsia sp.]|nr:thioredoxin fold domain-containing protein [Williamsia sp.]